MNDTSRDDEGRLSDQELAAALPRSRGGNEARVGIFVILGLLSFVVVLFLMTDPATMRGRYMVVTTVDDAGGVRRGDPVQMRGVIIGRINGFEMMPNGRVAIRMELEGEWRIPEGSRTELGAAGLFGGRTMEVIPTTASVYVEEGDTIPGGDGGGGGILGSADELAGQAGTVLARLEALLDPSTVQSVQGSAADLEIVLGDLSTTIAEQRSALRTLTASLSRSAAGLEEASAAGPDAARAIARADSAMAQLAVTSRNLDEAALALRDVMQRMNEGEGTLGRLSTDEALYQNMNRAAESIATLVADIQANPGRYINVSIF